MHVPLNLARCTCHSRLRCAVYAVPCVRYASLPTCSISRLVCPRRRLVCPRPQATEYKTEFSLWSLTSSPLVLASDPRNMTALQQHILLNKEVLAVDQDVPAPAHTHRSAHPHP